MRAQLRHKTTNCHASCLLNCATSITMRSPSNTQVYYIKMKFVTLDVTLYSSGKLCSVSQNAAPIRQANQFTIFLHAQFY